MASIRNYAANMMCIADFFTFKQLIKGDLIMKIIEYLIESAKHFNGFNEPVELKKIRGKAIILSNFEKSSKSFDAVLNYSTINMHSRFPDIKDKRKRADWLKNPVFYRIKRGFYKLLNDEDGQVFKWACDNDIELIYKDEYDFDLLKKYFKENKKSNN